jgi:dolichol-phosphate mannosyltransferase
VGFLDGAQLIKVRMYAGFQDTWSGWGRSLDLKDASSYAQLWADLGLLVCTQGLPLILSPLLLWGLYTGFSFLTLKIALGVNLLLLLIRISLLWAISPSYYRGESLGTTSWWFWLSPLADPLAVLRIFLSSTQRPTSWRGRNYGQEAGGRRG